MANFSGDRKITNYPTRRPHLVSITIKDNDLKKRVSGAEMYPCPYGEPCPISGEPVAEGDVEADHVIFIQLVGKWLTLPNTST